MKNGRARDLDGIKTIVLLILILLLILFLWFFCCSSSPIIAEIPASQSSVPTAASAGTVPAAAPPVSSPFAAGPQTGSASNGADCPLAAPARISGVGARVRVVNALIPMRTKPSVPSSGYVLPLHMGSVLEIISLPVCEPFLENANLWWQVRAQNGRTGWAAEASAIKPILYYLEEIN